MKKYFFKLFIGFFLLLASPSGFAQKKITVAVAANMRYTIEQLKTIFEKETGIAITIISGASGKLTAQIEEGAPFDVFVSADMNYPEELFKKGFAINKPKCYAKGILVLWTTKTELNTSNMMQLLKSPEIKKIAIANPKTAPYGAAAEEVLKHYNIFDVVKSKLVMGESIAQTQQFIETQAAEIGFIAKSLVLAPQLKDKGRWVAIDSNAYKPIKQGAVILKYGKDNNYKISKQFYDFLYSSKIQGILKQSGYIVNE